MTQSDTSYRPRVSTEITLESKNQLQRILPHGWHRPLFQALVDGVIELHRRGGIEAISAIIARHITIQQIAEVGFDSKIED